MTSIPSVQLTISDSKRALAEILEAFKQPENVSKMQEARENTGNNMLKMMQFVFPLATQIQMNIITKYGFTADGPGIVRFTQIIKGYEKEDEEICRLNTQLRSIVLPLIPLPATSMTIS